MNQNTFFATLEKDFKINEEMKKQFIIYKNFLQQQNAIHNLTRLDKEEIIYDEYFYESIVPYKSFDFNNVMLLDIGSGSGIPGLVLKILFPKMHLTILEANTKKIHFMQELAAVLGFDDVVFWNQRAEEIQGYQYEQFDVVTSRAVASLKVILEISAPYAKVGGYLIEPKSLNYEQEYQDALPIMQELQLTLKEIRHFKEQKEHFVFFIIKDTITNRRYPRKWKDIIK